MAAPYQLKPHERPTMPGSPATPDHPTNRRVLFGIIGILLALTGGFQNGLLLASLPQVQGQLGLTPVEGGWVTAAYMMTTTCMSMLLYKVRQQFGLQRFLRVLMLALVAANAVQLAAFDYRTELLARGIGGIVASGMSALCIFYFLQAMPAKARLAALLVGVGLTQIAAPFARVLSPLLIGDGDVAPRFFFQFALSLMSLGATMLLPIPSGDTANVFEPADLISFPMFAGGVALLIAVLIQGRIVWWDTAWLGYALAGSILLLGASLLIEHNRANPMLQTRWLRGPDIIRFALVGASVRLLLSEQSVGGAGLLGALGMGPAQLITFYVIVTAASLGGLALSIVRLDPMDLIRPTLTALALIAIASFADYGASLQTRPEQLYVTQAVIGFAALYYMGPTMMEGLLRALAKGQSHVISFSAIFGLSQAMGGLIGAAALSTFITVRTRTHLIHLGEQLTLSNPQVQAALRGGAAALAPTMGDPALLSSQGAAGLVGSLGRDATVLAFNDLFLLIGSLATLAFVIVGGRWLILRHKGINPLAEELAAMAQMSAAKGTP